MSFTTFQFTPEINAAIATCGYQTPTPIQQQAMPPVLDGHDLLGLAQTGTGKTAAFVLPMLQRLSQGKRGGVRALIVAPTRELAEQIHREIAKMAKQTELRSLAVYGGVSKFGQRQKLRRGIDIVVACPGRLLDHLDSGSLALDRVEMLVLDEADQMFDMGFLPPIRRILKALPQQRQTLLFSATMPAAIQHLADEILHEPVRVKIDHQPAAAKISHQLYQVAPQQNAALLLNLMDSEAMDATLVFTKTRAGAQQLASQLQGAGHSATSIQGDLSHHERQLALQGFRTGRFKVLVATDIAARGIDVASISHVINFDMPDNVEAFTHRVGRTGRASRSGTALTFAGRHDQRLLAAIEKSLGTTLSPQPLPTLAAVSPVREAKQAARPHKHTAPSSHSARRDSAARNAGEAGPKRGRHPQETRTKRPAQPAFGGPLAARNTGKPGHRQPNQGKKGADMLPTDWFAMEQEDRQVKRSGKVYHQAGPRPGWQRPSAPAPRSAKESRPGHQQAASNTAPAAANDTKKRRYIACTTANGKVVRRASQRDKNC